MKPAIPVTKLDAARRQLEVAIQLYFSEADPVSIHTLTSAAYQILADVNRTRGGRPMLKEAIPTWVQPAEEKVARRRLSKAANFFKHADRDHDQVLDFTSGPTELLLYDAVIKYRELTGELVPILAVYGAWFPLGPGAIFIKTPEHEAAIAGVRQAFPRATTRAAFFSQVLPIISALPRR